MRATFSGHKEVVQLLLESGADRYLENVDGQTGLTMAEDIGQTIIAEMLSAG